MPQGPQDDEMDAFDAEIGAAEAAVPATEVRSPAAPPTMHSPSPYTSAGLTWSFRPSISHSSVRGAGQHAHAPPGSHYYLS